MRKIIAGILSFGVIVALGLLNLSTAHAQDMSIWQGKWFQISHSMKGYCAETSGLQVDQWTTQGYIKFIYVDQTFKQMKTHLYVEEIG